MLLSIINKGLIRLGRRAECVSLLACSIALLLVSNGCRQLQLPAIDPNGRCLFLPLTNTTQLDIPPLHSSPGQQGIIPTPAYQAPVAPAPCVGANCEPGGVCNLFHRKHDCLQKIHDHFRCPGKLGELQLTPLRVVAPVGGEVVLLAGICGEDGYLVKREPIEWMIAPDSVGQIIEVNDDAPGKLSSLLHPHRPKVEKLGVDFAKGRTSSKTQIIDRGTPNCDDDIHLRDGETWVSISSPTAGITRVTSLAPESKIWDRRRQTAVIYWLDAKWDLPAPQIVKSQPDQRVPLRTKVTKSEQLVPATGWLVQYTILNPAIATFVRPDGQRVEEPTVRTIVDQNGIGYVELAPRPGAMGTTQVQIDVISPAQPDDNLPELPVGSGQTFVTFSAAGLLIQANVPEVITKGDQFTISATLANPGDLPADNTQLRVDLPPGLQIIPGSIQPSSQNTQQTDRSASWDQGVLPANRQLDVSFTVAAVQSGDFRVRFEAAANGIQNVIEERPISINEPMVEVRFAPAGGVSQAEVGDIVKYEIDLANTGRSTVTNLKLLVKTTAGLVEATKLSNSVEQVIPVLRPGEKSKLEIPFRITQEGQQEASLFVQSGTAVLANPIAKILGQPQRKRQPDIGVEIVFPADRQSKVLRAGESHKAQILVRNTGATTLTNLEVQIAADENQLQFIGVDRANENFASGSRGNVRWTPPNMLPGEGSDTIRVLLLEVRALAPTPVAAINVIARSAEGVQATAANQVEIRDDRIANPPLGGNPVMPNPNNDPGLGGGVMPPANNPPFNPAPNNPPPNNPPANNPPSGRLRISINDFNDPEVVGKEIRYSVRIANDSNQISGRTQVELRVSEGAELLAVSSDGSNVTPRRGANGTIVLPTLEAFRVGEEVAYTIYMRSRIPQVMRIEATVRSDLFPNGETANETTTITAAN